MIATAAEFTRERRRHAARRAWADPMRRARILAGQLIAADERRRTRLVESHLHLLDLAAAHWSRRYPILDRDDLRQAAYFGLRRAAERFDPERGVLFSTFAFHGLRDAIQRELPSLLGMVRVPKRPTAPRPSVASFEDDAPEPEDEGTTSNPYEVASRAEDRERVRFALGKLRPRDALVAELRFGINGAGRTHTYAEVGERLGVTGERVRQIEARALSRLRAALADRTP